MRRLTIATGDGYSSPCCKRELAERLGIIEDVLETTCDAAENRRRWERYRNMMEDEE